MIDKQAARKLALDSFAARYGPDAATGEPEELREGWFVLFRTQSGIMTVGSNGVIVNKRSGKALTLGSAFHPSRDCAHASEAVNLSHRRPASRAVRALYNVGAACPESFRVLSAAMVLR